MVHNIMLSHDLVRICTKEHQNRNYFHEQTLFNVRLKQRV